MKAIHLYANEDAALESRLHSAIELTRSFEGHLTCIHITPYNAFIAGDPFGGFYALPSLVEELDEGEAVHRAKVQSRLKRSGISWDWVSYVGQAAQVIVDRSRLADLVIVSNSVSRDRLAGPLTLAADLALHVRPSVLAVPYEASGPESFETAVIAWNGSAEVGQALRLSLPMLRQAKYVHIVNVKDEDIPFPAAAAGQYLALHGIPSKLHERGHADSDVADVILEVAREIGGNFIVMGAYGHSRLREAVLGGATRSMLNRSEIPLMLAH